MGRSMLRPYNEEDVNRARQLLGFGDGAEDFD
jgi:hypothetical protein